MPKISVIIPVYNVEKYLRKCLDSVVNQTLKDIEIICVNDGSTDSSLQILEEYAQKDTRIKIISKENGGLASARNVGLRHITGEFCHFLDSDDYIEPELYEYAVKIFDNFDIDYFCFSSKSFVEGDSIIQNPQDIDNYIYIKRDGLYNLNFDIGMNTNIHVWNKIFKTEKIQQNNLHFIDGLLYEDIYFVWMYLFLSKQAYFEEQIFHRYRMRSNSIMEQNTENKTLKTGIDHLLNWYELYKSISQDKELFIQNYDNLLRLLDMYRFRTKEMVPQKDKHKVELLNLKYYKEITAYKKSLSKSLKFSFWERIFSVKNTNDKKHKVITIFGIKFKVRRKAEFHTMLVHLHVYYHEQIDFYLKHLKNITNCNWDLYVTVVEDNQETVNKILKLKPNAKILRMKNIGYDIYPFIYVLRQVDLNQYDYIMKLHTKNYQNKEPYWHGKGWTWRNLLVNALLASKKQFKMCLKILENPKIGEIGAQNTLVYMGNKFPEDTYLYDKYCKNFKISNTRGHFIAGSMFIAKSNVMNIIKNLPCKEEDFKNSIHTGDKATLAHVIERFLGVLVEKQEYSIAGIDG